MQRVQALPQRFSGEEYESYFKHELLEHLETRNKMWLIHNRAPPHFSLIDPQLIDENYCNLCKKRDRNPKILD